MEIIINSRENGWETERRLELPEDERLVKSILRNVARRKGAEGQPKQKGERPAEELCPKEPGDLPDEEPNITEAEALEPEQEVRTTPETVSSAQQVEGYSGFLLVDCAGCGKLFATSVRENTEEITCRSCGHSTRLAELRDVRMYCRTCKQEWRYRTNSERAEVSCSCVQCRSTLRAVWNKGLKKYVPK